MRKVDGGQVHEAKATGLARLTALWPLMMAFAITIAFAAATAQAQTDSARMMTMAEHAMMGHADSIAMRHMTMTAARAPTHKDSVRAKEVAAELKRAIAKYEDTAAAVADGFKMFLPNVKNQRVYHFTNYGWALMEAFRFSAGRPTSLLYSRGEGGKLRLIGAMYTAPRRMSASKLDDRVPLSIARWHQHVNWCVPKKSDQARWTEQKNGHPVFGPESPIATKADCEKAGGMFLDTLFGWMLHANVYESTDLGTVFGEP